MDILSNLTRTLSEIIDRHLDEIELSILKVFAHYGCISIYRASNLAGFAISTTYKKAKRLIEHELLKMETTHSYRITVKGLLYCVAEDRESSPYMINKIRLYWRLNSRFDEICAYLFLLARALKVQNIKLSQVPSLNSIKETYKYILTPLISFIADNEHLVGEIDSIEELIAKALDTDRQIVKLSSKILNNIISNYLLKALVKIYELISGERRGEGLSQVYFS